jgi:hypothetical protein
MIEIFIKRCLTLMLMRKTFLHYYMIFIWNCKGNYVKRKLSKYSVIKTLDNLKDYITQTGNYFFHTVNILSLSIKPQANFISTINAVGKTYGNKNNLWLMNEEDGRSVVQKHFCCTNNSSRTQHNTPIVYAGKELLL